MASTRTLRAVCAPVLSRLAVCGAAVRGTGARLVERARGSHDHGGPPMATPDGSQQDSSSRVTFEELTATGRFVRDTHLGGMFHKGQVSLREDSPRGSLHVSLKEGNRISVHLDRYSPLAEARARRRPSRSRYSVVRVVVHNVGIVVDYVVLFVTRRFGEHRCELECEKVEIVDTETGEHFEIEVCEDDVVVADAEAAADSAPGQEAVAAPEPRPG